MLEIEAKFALPADFDTQRLSSLQALAGFALSSAQIKKVHDTYLESTSKAVERLGYVVRQRVVNCTETLFTVKSRNSSGGALSIREEYEFPIGQSVHPEDWPTDIVVRQKFIEALKAEDLAPYFEIRQTRHSRDITVQDKSARIAEWTLDFVEVWLDDQQLDSFAVLEVELEAAGTQAQLDEIVAAIEAKFGLKSVAVAKLARAERAVLSQQKTRF